MKKYGLLLALTFMVGTLLHAQGIETVLLDSSVHNTVRPVSGDGTRIYDDGGFNGHYSVGEGRDLWVTISGNCTAPDAFCFIVEEVDLRFKNNGHACPDTLFIYDGPDTNSPLLWFATGNVIQPNTYIVFAGPNNVSQSLTLRLKVCGDCGSWNNTTGNGFSVLVDCRFPCETITPVLDSIFYKTRNGVIYEFGRIKTLYDTVMHKEWDAFAHDSITIIDSVPFFGVNLCMGDGVIFTAHCDYSNNNSWYTPSDSTTIFEWNFGTGDSLRGQGITSVYFDQYFRVDCYELKLNAEDEKGCKPAIFPSVRVRVAENPLKTIFTLADICNNDSLYVNMGYDGDNATLTLRTVVFEDVKTKTNDARTFIPDGPNCPGSNCYLAPVVFDDFPGGRTVVSKDDICSICVNYEHSFMGDYSLAIMCPNGSKAYLKYKDNAPPSSPAGTSSGGSRYTGIPYGGSNDSGYDKMNGGNYCDTIYNPYGWGWNYCFSRNADYTLVNGQPANTPNPANAGMANGPTVSVTHTFWPIPAGYSAAGQTCGTVTCSTLDSSDHAGKMDYYISGDDFSTLIGCPLNGEWNIEICDNWSIDNGWVFSWALDICNIITSDCQYQVGIDSLVWAPDTASQYHDYELGHYRGAEVHRVNDIDSYILTPDTAGTFPIKVSIYDEFGCVWDTTTQITSYWAPMPDLGPDTLLCGVDTLRLYGTDRHAATENFSYIWAPYGQNTASILTQDNPGSDVRYIVQVTNTKNYTQCTTRDTINVKLRKQPYPSFVPEPFTLEGCDPLTLTFENHTVDGVNYFWDFGDGVTSTQASPAHTFTEGIYDLKYYVSSDEGCADSLIFEKSIAVYSSPKASFSWDPVYPSILNPVMQFQNNTTPKTDDTKYFWEIQYNKQNALSVQTLTDENPTFDFSTYADPGDVAGNYTVRLIARTDNLAPSGNIVYCRDTSENAILLVNDFLQFPNVVTPNGDGVNDRFVILNLIEGMGYPVNTLDVYNKWGTRVFHTENIATEEDFWDPADVPAGTYFYRFSARGYNGNIEHNGAIEVIK